MNSARVLREARRRAGLSQRELARATGIAQPTIARIEAGASVPRVDSLDRLLRACGESLLAITRPGRGVDVTLFDRLERMSPAERIAANQSHAQATDAFRIASVAERGIPGVELIETLRSFGVRFVLIGGLAGVALGSPVITHDLDICYARDPDNIARLVKALRSIQASLRGAPDSVPAILDERMFKHGRNFTFETSLGSFDCVGEPAGAYGGFDELDRNAETVYFGGGVLRVCSLSDLIRMKLAAGRLKDRMHLEWLVALQDRIESRSGPVVVIDPGLSWEEAFNRVREHLHALATEIGAEIEHVGSTAVEGLAGRPVLDVDVVVPGPAELASATEMLLSIGYRSKGDLDGTGRQTFRAPEQLRYHHLSVVIAGSKAHEDDVLLRDFLRRHREEVERYATLKRRLAADYAHDRELYELGKAPFIEELLERARSELGR